MVLFQGDHTLRVTLIFWKITEDINSTSILKKKEKNCRGKREVDK